MDDVRPYRTMTIMPTVDGRRMAELLHVGQVPARPSDDQLGKVVGDCMRTISAVGYPIDEHMITLEIKFA